MRRDLSTSRWELKNASIGQWRKAGNPCVSTAPKMVPVAIEPALRIPPDLYRTGSRDFEAALTVSRFAGPPAA
jgi:hypothetical protein